MPCHLCSGRRQRWPDPPLPRRVRHGQDHDGQRCCPACQQEGAAHQLPLAGVQRGWRGCTLHIQVGLGLFWHAIGPSCNYSISSAIRQAMVSPSERCRILSHCAGDTWIKMASVWTIDLRSPATTCKVSQHPCRGMQDACHHSSLQTAAETSCREKVSSCTSLQSAGCHMQAFPSGLLVGHNLHPELCSGRCPVIHLHPCSAMARPATARCAKQKEVSTAFTFSLKSMEKGDDLIKSHIAQ